MKTTNKFFSAIVIAASLSMASISCQKEIPAASGQEVHGIHVSVNAGIADTKSAVVTENGIRTLTFTSGDKLYVSASLMLDLGEGSQNYTLSGNLDVDTIGADATTATFEGELKLYKYSMGPEPEEVTYDFGTDNPLALCDYARALLVHEGTSIVSGGLMGGGYFENIASSVNELMTSCLNVSGDYDAGSNSFTLSAASSSGEVLPIFNCTITGLTPNALYEIYLLIGEDADDARGDRALGGKSADASGQLTFACYSSIYASQAYYYAFRFKNGNDWMRAELGTKQLESKVYNITRAASADPASPVQPTVTGTEGTWNQDLSVYYHDVADITISGTSKGYFFNLYAGGTVRL
ncbi:MAG: hypothetical protein IKH11_10410, partial [Bacteroidales bacterium]|nr:hypothetical protein [Bacteroidales bacterium]